MTVVSVSTGRGDSAQGRRTYRQALVRPRLVRAVRAAIRQAASRPGRRAPGRFRFRFADPPTRQTTVFVVPTGVAGPSPSAFSRAAPGARFVWLSAFRAILGVPQARPEDDDRLSVRLRTVGTPCARPTQCYTGRCEQQRCAASGRRRRRD